MRITNKSLEAGPVRDIAELLGKLRQGASRPATVVQATLSVVAGQPAQRAAEALTLIRSELKESQLPGESSVGTIRAACQAISDHVGPDASVPRWASASEAREDTRRLQRRRASVAPAQSIDAELRRLAREICRLPANSTDLELLNTMRSYAARQVQLRQNGKVFGADSNLPELS